MDKFLLVDIPWFLIDDQCSFEKPEFAIVQHEEKRCVFAFTDDDNARTFIESWDQKGWIVARPKSYAELIRWLEDFEEAGYTHLVLDAIRTAIHAPIGPVIKWAKKEMDKE